MERGVIVTDDRNDALLTKQRMESNPVVDNVIWLEDFIPQDQDQKLFIIDEINLLLAGGFSNTELNHDLTPAEKLEVLSNFINENDASSLVQESQTINSFLNNIQIFKDQLTSSSPQQLEIAMDSFSTTMLASLPGRLDLLNASLNADYVST